MIKQAKCYSFSPNLPTLVENKFLAVKIRLGNLVGLNPFWHDAWVIGCSEKLHHKTLSRCSKKAILLLRRNDRNKYNCERLRASWALLSSAAKAITLFSFFCLRVYFLLYKNLWTSISSALPRIPIILHLSVCPLRGSLIKLCREKVTLITNSTCLNFSIFVFVLQTIGLGLMRSDYFNTAGNKILAVEFNTIASSFGGLSSQFQHFHR